MSGVGRFLVACPNSGMDPAKGKTRIPIDYQLNSDQIPADGQKTPTFAYIGQFYSTNCSLDEPFDGHLNCILEPDVEIKSIES